MEIKEELKRFWDEQKDAFIIPYNDMIDIINKEFWEGYHEGENQGDYPYV